jgi:hypothetical protein
MIIPFVKNYLPCDFRKLFENLGGYNSHVRDINQAPARNRRFHKSEDHSTHTLWFHNTTQHYTQS